MSEPLIAFYSGSCYLFLFILYFRKHLFFLSKVPNSAVSFRIRLSNLESKDWISLLSKYYALCYHRSEEQQCLFAAHCCGTQGLQLSWVFFCCFFTSMMFYLIKDTDLHNSLFLHLGWKVLTLCIKLCGICLDISRMSYCTRWENAKWKSSSLQFSSEWVLADVYIKN